MADVLALTHACTTAADALVNNRRYVPLTCRRDLQISDRPDGKMADVLASTLACATANASVNYSGYVPQRS